MPLANGLVRPEAAGAGEDRFPLDVAWCPGCSLVQVLHAVSPSAIFEADYPYFSSFSQDLLDHSERHARALVSDRELGPDSFVVEVASNDGYFLKNLADKGIPVLGIDPASGPAEAAEAAGIPTVREYFGQGVGAALRDLHGPADVIVANNVMAHVPDLNDFVAGFRELISDDGLITIENPWVADLVDRLEFDTIYHEHYSYFSCTAVDALVRRHGLFLNHVEYFPDLHGGTLRWYVQPFEDATSRIEQFLADERRRGLNGFDHYTDFAYRVAKVRRGLRELLHDLRDRDMRIVGYGAAAKGATLLNYAGIGTDVLDYIVDRNVHKQGLLMPGVHVPIVSPDRLLTDAPDYVVLLAWNFEREIRRQQSASTELGGRFIVPLPEPKVLA